MHTLPGFGQSGGPRLGLASVWESGGKFQVAFEFASPPLTSLKVDLIFLLKSLFKSKMGPTFKERRVLVC